MQALGPAPPAPSTEELIAALEESVKEVMRNDMSEDSDMDRTRILAKNFNNYLYSRGLQNYAGQLFQNILSLTSISGPVNNNEEDQATGSNDYTQKHYTGFKRKFTAVIGNRLANVKAIPNNPSDETGVQATRSANPAAIYIRDTCDLESKFLDQAGRLFDFATTFWLVDWVEDGDKYGYRDEPQMEPQDQALGNAHFQCPDCGAGTPSEPQPQAAPVCSGCQKSLSMDNFVPPTTVPGVPTQTGTKKVPKGALEILLLDSNEVSVPLDATGIDDCDRIRWERERPKGKLLRKYGDKLREEGDMNDAGGDTVSSQLGELVRSAMASPIGLVRTNRVNRWTCVDEWWTPNQYELVKEKDKREMLQQNFPEGARFIFVKGKLLDIKAAKLRNQWQETKPEPAPRIMTDALGDEWTETTDIANNTMNYMEETVSRANLPTLVNATKWDMDAWNNRNMKVGEFFPLLPRAGMPLSNEVYTPPGLTFSEQAPIFRNQVIDDAKSNTGLVDAIWGGGTPDPTARQTLLKTNQALMQLGTHWTQIRKSLEKMMLKACKMLSQYAEGLTSFSKKNQFGRFDTLSFTAADLRSDSYHFEADEAIPVNWGQQRDQLMWLLGQAGENPQLLQKLGLDDPFNIFEIKQLLGIPGMHTPQFDAREKGMDVIAQLLTQKAQAGPPNPDGSPGELQPSIQPDWEDDSAFMSQLAKAYLLDNTELKKNNPDGYDNIQAWGKAHDAIANPPQAPAEPKETLAVSFKGGDLGPAATQAILQKRGLLDENTPVASDTDKKLATEQQMANGMPQVPNGAPPPQAAPPQPIQ